MSPSPPPSPTILDQRTVCYYVFSVVRKKVSFQVCPKFGRTSTCWGRESGSLG